ncbi:hypothetical protein [Burkholderia pseudomallei]|uniref:hypothetical protein n=1 Tax=Burkholderia pseudomallei TaxID=28450 RepID=UPI000A6150DF|nr:hypothetical protein [Burkholderia pseudomallei]
MNLAMAGSPLSSDDCANHAVYPNLGRRALPRIGHRRAHRHLTAANRYPHTPRIEVAKPLPEQD